MQKYEDIIKLDTSCRKRKLSPHLQRLSQLLYRRPLSGKSHRTVVDGNESRRFLIRELDLQDLFPLPAVFSPPSPLSHEPERHCVFPTFLPGPRTEYLDIKDFAGVFQELKKAGDVWVGNYIRSLPSARVAVAYPIEV